MFLTQIRIKNFQQHSDLTINLTNSVNYIVGKSGCGKSTVLRAISFVLFNEPHSDDVIRPDTKTEGKRQPPTSVAVVLDSGIEVERVKSSAINRYIVRKNGEEIIYDSVASSIPEEVKKILQVSTLTIDKEELNLNFAEQISLPFLYDKSGSFRLKLFNHLTGADLIDRLVQLMNKEILQFGRDIKSTQEFIDLNEPKLKEVTIQVEEKHKVYGKVKKIYEEVKTKILTLQMLQKLESSVKESKASIFAVQEALQGVKFVPEEAIVALKSQIDSYVALKQIQGSYWVLNEDLLHVQSALSSIVEVSQETVTKLRELIDRHFILEDLKGALDENIKQLEMVENSIRLLKFIKIDTEAVRLNVEQLDKLWNVQSSLNESSKSFEDIQKNIKNLEIEILSLGSKKIELLKESGVCPLCGKVTCEINHA